MVRILMILACFSVFGSAITATQQFHDNAGKEQQLSKANKLFIGRTYNSFINLLQLSYDESEEEEDGTIDDESKIITVFLLNLIACALCCGFVQGVIIVSKKMNVELITLRKNFKQFESLRTFRKLTVTMARQGREFEV